jgi:cell division septal protein FtsQ
MRIHPAKPKHKADSRKQAKTRFRLFLALCAGILVEVICILVMLPSVLFGGGTREKPAAFGVVSVTVVGNTQYDEQAILQMSGIREGQSVFVLDRNKAANEIKANFHYVEDVKVKVDWNRNVTIEIAEAQPLGAVYANGQWVVVSQSGRGLYAEPIRSQRPLRYLYIKGAKTVSALPGEQVLDSDSLALLKELFDSLSYAGLLDDISVVDIGNRGDIRLNWKNQITLLLGNDSNLPFEIAAAAGTIPKVLEKHGQTATGVLNLIQHSDPTIESPAIIFTPSSLLNGGK